MAAVPSILLFSPFFFQGWRAAACSRQNRSCTEPCAGETCPPGSQMSCSCNKTSPSHFAASAVSTYFTTDGRSWDNVLASSTLTQSRISSRALTAPRQVSWIYKGLMGDEGLVRTLPSPGSALPRTAPQRAPSR